MQARGTAATSARPRHRAVYLMVVTATLVAVPGLVRGDHGEASVAPPNHATSATDGLRRHVERDHPNRLSFPAWAPPRPADRVRGEYHRGLRHGQGFTGGGRSR